MQLPINGCCHVRKLSLCHVCRYRKDEWMAMTLYCQRLAWVLPAWTNNHIPNKIWNEITLSLPNFDGCTVEIWERTLPEKCIWKSHWKRSYLTFLFPIAPNRAKYCYFNETLTCGVMGKSAIWNVRNARNKIDCTGMYIFYASPTICQSFLGIHRIFKNDVHITVTS